MRDRELESLSGNILTEATVEELEQRLEMQMLMFADDETSECIGHCKSECDTKCKCQGVASELS